MPESPSRPTVAEAANPHAGRSGILRRMPCLVTGGAGFLGAHVARALLDAGHEVVVLDDLSGGFADNVDPRARLVTGSIVDHDAVDALFAAERFDHVFHLAAYAAEGLSPFIKRFNYTNNVIGSVNLINASVNFNVRCFVFTSSIAVYGSGQVPMTEDLLPQPEDSYGIAKYAVEQELRASHEFFGLDYVIFRPHNVYGELQNIGDRYRNVLGIFMNQIMRDEPLTIFGDGTQTRAFSYVGDVAPAIARRRGPTAPAARSSTSAPTRPTASTSSLTSCDGRWAFPTTPCATGAAQRGAARVLGPLQAAPRIRGQRPGRPARGRAPHGRMGPRARRPRDLAVRRHRDRARAARGLGSAARGLSAPSPSRTGGQTPLRVVEGCPSRPPLQPDPMQARPPRFARRALGNSAARPSAPATFSPAATRVGPRRGDAASRRTWPAASAPRARRPTPAWSPRSWCDGARLVARRAIRLAPGASRGRGPRRTSTVLRRTRPRIPRRAAHEQERADRPGHARARSGSHMPPSSIRSPPAARRQPGVERRRERHGGKR